MGSTRIGAETYVRVSTFLGGTTLPLPVSTVPASATSSAVTRQAVSIVNVTLKAANANRRGLAIHNNTVASNLFIKLGAVANIGAGTESFTIKLVPGGYYEVPFGYTGIVDGIWDAAEAAGEALITEITP